MSLQLGFSIFEVLVAWIFVVLFLYSAIFAELDSFRMMRKQYQEHFIATQLFNLLRHLRLKNSAMTLSREQIFTSWQKQNQRFNKNLVGNYFCDGIKCHDKLSVDHYHVSMWSFIE